MDIEIPKWLTTDFIKSTIDNHLKNKITIIDIQIKRAVPKGNNYMSNILRIKVTYCKESSKELITNSLIVKSALSGGLSDLLINFGIIQKEVLMYQEYVPRFSAILHNDEQIIPISLQSSIENVIILEDLSFHGFKMVNRLKQLDLAHCELALKSLALFHAASIKLNEIDPLLVKEVGKEQFFHEDLKEKSEFLGISQIELVLIEISNWPEMSGYMETLKQLPAKMWDLLINCFKSKIGFYVLNHGDFWVTNMLFRYDSNGEPSEVKFIDLQLSRFATPAIDLIYFLQGSVPEEIRTKKRDDLLKIYLTALNQQLERFGCATKQINQYELNHMLKDSEFYEFYTNITLVPVVVMENDHVFELKEMSEKHIKENLENNPFRRHLQGDRYRKLFTKRFIQEFSKHEWFTDMNDFIIQA